MPTEGSELALLFGGDAPKPRRVSRCACCGAPAEYRVQVQVARVNRAAKNVQGQMRSTSVRVCEGCAPDSFFRAVAAAGDTREAKMFTL